MPAKKRTPTTIPDDIRRSIHEATNTSAIDPDRFLPGRLLRALEEAEADRDSLRADDEARRLLVQKHLDAMLTADSKLFDHILDTPVFAFHFNELCLMAQRTK